MNLDGIDADWVCDQLVRYIDETHVGVVNPLYAGTYAPRCGRFEAIRLTETIRPILDRLYPDWKVENSTVEQDEFKQVRDAAQRLIARLSSHLEVAEKLGGLDNSPRIRASELHPLIWQAASAQWLTGHRHEAVLAAAKQVNSILQTKVSRRDISDLDLVKQAFSKDAPQPQKPRLRYSQVSSDQTAESMRRGVMEFGSGCFSAIRNPVSHLPNSEIELTEHTALERLCAFSLFARFIDEADLEVAPPGGP
ncbi:TIGR02391 family protein [Nocardia salmonicida]|uniref:TIGR02391 family protein n=1 Tax=Nocardia salmonicida TaxID=53431 RepID=UPI0037BD8F75